MIIFLRQLTSIGLSIIVNSMNILYCLGWKNALGALATPKQYKSHWWAKQND